MVKISHLCNIREVRKAAKISKKAAAKLIGCHSATITRLEDGNVIPQLEALANAYGRDICLLPKGWGEILNAQEVQLFIEIAKKCRK